MVKRAQDNLMLACTTQGALTSDAPKPKLLGFWFCAGAIDDRARIWHLAVLEKPNIYSTCCRVVCKGRATLWVELGPPSCCAPVHVTIVCYIVFCSWVNNGGGRIVLVSGTSTAGHMLEF